MKQIKIISIGLLIAVIIFIGGIVTGKYHYSTHDIKVVEVNHSETIWKEKIKYVYTEDNFDKCYDWYNSPLLFRHKTYDNLLEITAYDSAKEATATFKIGTKGNWSYYIGFGIIGALAGTTAVLLLR